MKTIKNCVQVYYKKNVIFNTKAFKNYSRDYIFKNKATTSKFV